MCTSTWFDLVSAYVDGECSAAEESVVEVHLAQCGACARVAATFGELRRRARVWPVPVDGEGLGCDIPWDLAAARDRGTPRWHAPLSVIAALLVVVLVGIAFVGGRGGTSGLGRDVAATVMTRPDRFGVSELTIHRGERVSWRNDDPGVVHDIRVSTSDGTRGARLGPGDHLEVAFDRPGRFTYHCMIHQAMVGSVQVSA